MTIGEILSTMIRRWYVPVLTLACVAVATVLLARDGGVYTTTTVVSFMRAASTSLSPSNGANDSSVIAFAGVVVEEANNGRPAARYSTEDAPYYGAGVREGVLIELANSGNQWVSTFSRADVEIRIVGRSFDWVQARQRAAIDTVLGIAEGRQRAIAPRDRISAAVVPLTVNITAVEASRSAQIAAAGAMFAVGLILSAWGAVTVDRMALARRTRDDAAATRAPAGSVSRAQDGVAS